MTELKIAPIQNPDDWQEFCRMASSKEAYKSAVNEWPETLKKGNTTNSKKSGNLGIFLGQKIVGYSQYIVNAQNVGSFSIFIDEPHRDRGNANCSVALLNEFMFNEIEVVGIRHTVFLSNLKMIAILKNSGAIEVGVIRQGGRQIDPINGNISLKPCIILEFNSLDFMRVKKNRVYSAAHSYGIDNSDFLNSEIKRLAVQTSITMAADDKVQSVLKMSAGKSVMDVGAGLGGIAARYAGIFPDINFVALEVNRQFVECAKESTMALGLKNLQIIHGDFFDSDDLIRQTDVFLFRLVAQHLGVAGFAKALQKIEEIRGKTGFKLIVSDIDDRLWIFEPPSPAINLALEAANVSQSKYGGDRNIGAKILCIAKNNHLDINGLFVNTFDTQTLGLETFDSILAPLFKEKLDPEYLTETAISDVQSAILQWKSNPCRFGAGGMFTYILERKRDQ